VGIPTIVVTSERGLELMMLVNIDVDDLARAAEFYCRALDLKPGRRFGHSAVELLGGSSAIYLLEKAAGTVATPVSSQLREYSRHWTPVHLDFVVPNLNAALARAQGAGASLEGEVNTMGAHSRDGGPVRQRFLFDRIPWPRLR